MEQLNLPVDVTRDLEEYSLAMQQMIAIARAVDMDCKVLILDEPTSSLDDVEVEKLFTLMRSLRDKGVGIIFVTHFLEQVYCRVRPHHRCCCNGTLVGEYPIADLPRVKLIAAMMGKDFDDLASIKPEGGLNVSKEELIDAEGLSHAGKIKPFDLQLHRGEVIGLTGLLGSGRSELARRHLWRRPRPDRHPQGQGRGGQDPPPHRRHAPGHGHAARRPQGRGHHRGFERA